MIEADVTAPSADELVVEHDPGARQFQVRVNGLTAVLLYRRSPRQIVFVHTEVPPTLQHRGIADALAHAGSEYARAEGLAVVPLCPFVAAYLRRHPEYQPLVQAK